MGGSNHSASFDQAVSHDGGARGHSHNDGTQGEGYSVNYFFFFVSLTFWEREGWSGGVRIGPMGALLGPVQSQCVRCVSMLPMR